MTGIVHRFVLAAVLSALAPSGALPVQWEPIGYGTLGDSSRFDVFIDTDSVRTADGKIRFWQGHVFYEEQPLPSGGSFIRVTIGKAVDCTTRSDSNVEAVFYAADGSVADRYDPDGQFQYKPVLPETISGAVLDYVCGSGKNDG